MVGGGVNIPEFSYLHPVTWGKVFILLSPATSSSRVTFKRINIPWGYIVKATPRPFCPFLNWDSGSRGTAETSDHGELGPRLLSGRSSQVLWEEGRQISSGWRLAYVSWPKSGILPAHSALGSQTEVWETVVQFKFWDPSAELPTEIFIYWEQDHRSLGVQRAGLPGLDWALTVV